MQDPRQRSVRAGRWVLVAAAVVSALMVGAAVLVWLSPERLSALMPSTSIPSAGPAADTAAAPSTPALDPAAVAAELTALAPELSPASAEMLAREVPNGSGPALAEMGLLFASRGFDEMERAELLELKSIFDEAYAALPPADGAWMGDYMAMVRDGSIDAAGSARGRALLTQCVAALPAPRRERLQALLEKAIRAGIALRRQADERSRAAMLEAPPAAADPPSAAFPVAPEPAPPAADTSVRVAVAGEGNGVGRHNPFHGEAYWRGRMRDARARVALLRASIEKLDKVANREAYGPSLEPKCTAPERLTTASERAYQDCLRVKQNWGVTQAAEQARRVEKLARMREELAAAERAVEELEDEARREGALPGWLRE